MTLADVVAALRRISVDNYTPADYGRMADEDYAILRAVVAALERAEERCALRRPDGSITWETLSDPLWGARRRADGMEVFDYLVISLDKEKP